MPHRKFLAAFAAVTAALALGVPMAVGSVATTTPAVDAASTPSTICVLLQQQIRYETQTGNTQLANLLSRVAVFMGCPH
jgi:hypothetical protein